ncbi:hypothetical protein GVN24_29260 [Rhizobium sp. CRIBSB]|nr:hypothetical protein [Rhizobium sp. CRIBSB]
MTRTAGDAPLAWLNARLALSFTQTTRDILGGDLVSSLLLPVISDANVGHLDRHPDGTRLNMALDGAFPDDLRHPANVSSIAASLDMPRETVRNKLEEMLETGLVHRSGGGIILRTQTLISERFLPAVPRYLDATADFVKGIADASGCSLQPGQALLNPVWPVAGAVLRLSTAHVLRYIANLRAMTPGVSLVDSFLVMAVMQETAAHLRTDPGALAQAAALGWAPMQAAGVSGLHLSRAFDIPRETVRRRLAALVAEGLLERSPAGYRLAATRQGEPLLQLQERTMADTRALIWRLCLIEAIPMLAVDP